MLASSLLVASGRPFVHLFNPSRRPQVLKVINRSAFDLQQVFNTLVEAGTQLCGADMGIPRRRVGDTYPLAATFGMKPEWREHVALHPNTPGRHSVLGRPFHVGVSYAAAASFNERCQSRPQGLGTVSLTIDGEIRVSSKFYGVADELRAVRAGPRPSRKADGAFGQVKGAIDRLRRAALKFEGCAGRHVAVAEEDDSGCGKPRAFEGRR